MKKKEIVFIVQCFERQDESSNLFDLCVVEVYAVSEQEALARAKSLITKAQYRISHVIEK